VIGYWTVLPGKSIIDIAKDENINVEVRKITVKEVVEASKKRFL